MSDLFTELIGWWKESKIKAISAALIFLIIILVIPLSIYKYENKKYELDNYGKYTVCKIKKISKVRGVYDTHFFYRVNSIIYKNVEVLQCKLDTSKYYYVKFL